MTVDQEAATRKQRQCVRERTQEPAEKESRKGHGDSRSDEKSGIDGAGVMTYRVCHLPPRLLLYVYEGCVAACVILELLCRTFATDWQHARSLSLQSSGFHRFYMARGLIRGMLSCGGTLLITVSCVAGGLLAEMLASAHLLQYLG